MALRIFEFNEVGRGDVPVRRVPFPVSQDNATVDGTSRQSAAFHAATKFVTIQTDTACYVLFGENPTATSAGFLLGTGTEYDFAVTPGHKVAWIAA
jgi:hypothetical protein